MKTRLIALALTLCMLFTLVPTALAVDGEAADRPLYYRNYIGSEAEQPALSTAPITCVRDGDNINLLTPALQLYTDAESKQEVADGLTFEPDAGTAEDAIRAVRGTHCLEDETELAVWLVLGQWCGSGHLVYTDANDARYSVAVSSVLPQQGFSSTTELTEESLLVSCQASFVLNEPFYYVFPKETVITAVESVASVNDKHTLSLEILTEQPNVCKVTITARDTTRPDQHLNIMFTLQSVNDPVFASISMTDVTPRFGFRNEYGGGEVGKLKSSITRVPGEQDTGGFFYGDTRLDVTAAAFLPDAGTDANAVIASVKSGSWRLQYRKLGSGILRCTTADAQTYDLPISIDLPYLGFYTEQTRVGSTYISDEFLYDTRKTDNTFWLISGSGYTAAEIDRLTVTCRDASWQEVSAAKYFTWEPVVRDDTTGGEDTTYDLKFTVKKGADIPERGISLWGEEKYGHSARVRIRDIDKTDLQKTDPSAMTVTIGGIDYVVGFAYDLKGIFSVDTEGKMAQQYVMVNGGSGTYRSVLPETTQGIAAATTAVSETDGGTETIFTRAGDDIQSMIHVSRVWLERRSGSRGTDNNTDSFSFSPNERQLELTEGLTTGGFPIYAADISGEAYLCAEITVNGKTGTVYTTVKYIRQSAETFKLSSSAAVNDWLESNKDRIAESAQSTQLKKEWTLYLTGGGDDYADTITLPEELGQLGGNNLNIRILGQMQTISGSIDLNGATINQISSLNFTAPEGSTTPAIQNGSAFVVSCTFTGYNIALGGGNVLVPRSCTFKNNSIAMVLNVPEKKGCILNAMERNLFENNGTAVQILSTNSFVSPYNIRIVDSAFIGNTTDFDVQTKGTFYFIRNYFSREGGLPVVNTSNGAEVYVNPVWKNRAEDGTLSELTLAASKQTRLPSDQDWSQAAISENALTADTRIDLADERGETVASWSRFDNGTSPQRAMRALRAADAGAADGFRPGVDILQSGGTLTITVPHSTALQSKQPLLTIPYTLPNATVTGPNNEEIAYTRVGNNLSFRVSAGGTYTVTAALPQVEYTDGTITVKNAPADAVQAIAALYSADDRLLQTAVAQVQDGTAELPLTVQAGQNCRVFLLDQGNKPVCSTIEP